MCATPSLPVPSQVDKAVELCSSLFFPRLPKGPYSSLLCDVITAAAGCGLTGPCVAQLRRLDKDLSAAGRLAWGLPPLLAASTTGELLLLLDCLTLCESCVVMVCCDSVATTPGVALLTDTHSLRFTSLILPALPPLTAEAHGVDAQVQQVRCIIPFDLVVLGFL